MYAQETSSLIERLYHEAWNQGNLDILETIVSPEFISHDLFPDREVHGVDGLKVLITSFRDAFPDLHVKVERQLDLGDRIACLVSFAGTHRAPLMGIPPSGKRLVAAWIDVVRVVDGMAVEEWICAGERLSPDGTIEGVDDG